MNTALSIAGSDPSGGAGIQADIKTMMSCGVYAMACISAVTAQNTSGVTDIEFIRPELLEAEIRAVFEDIRPDAVKIGMLGTKENIAITASLLREYEAKHIVVDPVMGSTAGQKLLQEDGCALLQELFSMAEVITPNLPEALYLLENIEHDEAEHYNVKHLDAVARELGRRFHTNVLLKGGHGSDEHHSADVLYIYAEESTAERILSFDSPRIDNPNTHGTGCTLSSAIASYLAKGYSLEEAVGEAKEYITILIQDGMNLGHGKGPLNHLAYMEK